MFVVPSGLSTPHSVGERTGADHSSYVYMCSFEHVAVHRALFVPLLLGLLMKESNWIFGLVLGRSGEGGAGPNPLKRGEKRGTNLLAGSPLCPFLFHSVFPRQGIIVPKSREAGERAFHEFSLLR